MLEKLFKLSEKKTSVKVEIMAGITTFLTMAYILGVNPGMLSSVEGLDFNSVFLATAIASGVACIIMGLLANYPVALSAGMGINAYFTYTVCLGYGFTFEEALAAVLVSGIAFFVISVTGLRKKIINSIPKSLKLSIGAGIGFFIAFIGFVNAGIVVGNPSTLVAFGDFTNPTVLLAIFGLLVSIYLMGKNVNAAAFYGLVITAVVGVIAGLLGVAGMPAMPTGIVSANFEIHTVGAAFSGLSTLFTKPEVFIVIFTFLFIDFFDTSGTLVAVGNNLGLVNDKGELENVEKALYADSIGTMIGAFLGTSTITSFVESGSGVAAGGKTGLTAITTGVLFFLSIFFLPLLSVVGAIPVDGAFLSPVTSPALIIVGILMITQLKDVNLGEFEVAASAFTVIIGMLLSYSIASGMAAGFIVYTVAHIAKGKARDVNLVIYLLDIAFIIYFML